MVTPNLDWPGKSRSGAHATIIGSNIVVVANSKRQSALFVNDSAAWMYLRLANVAALNSGIPLAPNGGWYEITLVNPYYGPLSVACGALDQILCWTENE